MQESRGVDFNLKKEPEEMKFPGKTLLLQQMDYDNEFESQGTR